MHSTLSQAAQVLAISLENIAAADAVTEERLSGAIEGAENSLAENGANRDDNEPLIVAFGSMARREMAPGSDFDHLVVLRSIEPDPDRIQHFRLASRAALRAIGAEEPGSSGLFDCAISAADLVNTIGLEGDSNLSHSRRILLLEESVPLNDAGGHRELVESVVARYLHEQSSRGSVVPRFLLNDIVRYWRTVAVDYQAKRWDEVEGQKWGLRYVKLRTTRKLTFAGAVVSTFWGPLSGAETNVPSLRDQFLLPSLARIAQLADGLEEEGQSVLRRVLVAADRIIGLLADDAFRTAVAPVSRPSEAPGGSAMAEARQIADEIDDALATLFLLPSSLGGRTFRDLSSKYLLF